MSAISLTGIFALYIAIYYGVTDYMGEDFIANLTETLFGKYIDLFNYYVRPFLPGFGNPFVIVLLLAIASILLPGFLRISRYVACFIIALVLVQGAFAMMGTSLAPMPSMSKAMMAVYCVGWLLLISVFSMRGLGGMFRRG